MKFYNADWEREISQHTLVTPIKLKYIRTIYNFVARKYISRALEYMSHILYVKYTLANISHFYIENICKIHSNYTTFCENIFHIFWHICYVYIFSCGYSIYFHVGLTMKHLIYLWRIRTFCVKILSMTITIRDQISMGNNINIQAWSLFHSPVAKILWLQWLFSHIERYWDSAD